MVLLHLSKDMDMRLKTRAFAHQFNLDAAAGTARAATFRYLDLNPTFTQAVITMATTLDRPLTEAQFRSWISRHGDPINLTQTARQTPAFSTPASWQTSNGSRSLNDVLLEKAKDTPSKRSKSVPEWVRQDLRGLHDSTIGRLEALRHEVMAATSLTQMNYTIDGSCELTTHPEDMVPLKVIVWFPHKMARAVKSRSSKRSTSWDPECPRCHASTHQQCKRYRYRVVTGTTADQTFLLTCDFECRAPACPKTASYGLHTPAALALMPKDLQSIFPLWYQPAIMESAFKLRDTVRSSATPTDATLQRIDSMVSSTADDQVDNDGDDGDEASADNRQSHYIHDFNLKKYNKTFLTKDFVDTLINLRVAPEGRYNAMMEQRELAHARLHRLYYNRILELAAEGEDFPPFPSVAELGWRWPSASVLRAAFVAELHGRYKGTCRMLELTGPGCFRTLAFDHTFKTAKLIRTTDDVTFSSIFTLMAGDSALLGLWMCQDESDNEIEKVLQATSQRFKELGQPPEVLYADDCCQRAGLLKKVFPDLVVGELVNEDITKLELQGWLNFTAIDGVLRTLPVELMSTGDDINTAVAQLLQDCVDLDDRTLSLDMEWTPPFKISKSAASTLPSGRTRGQVAMIQLCSPRHCYLLHVAAGGVTDRLKMLLQDATMTFTGLAVQGDLTRFHNELKTTSKARTIDLRTLANSCGIDGGGTMTLAALFENVTGRSLDKGGVRISNWDDKLSSRQETYAAIDVMSGQYLYSHLSRFRDLCLMPRQEGDTVVLQSHGGMRLATATITSLSPASRTATVKVVKVLLPSFRSPKLNADDVLEWDLTRTELKLEPGSPRPLLEPVAQDWKTVRIKLDIFHLIQRISKTLSMRHGAYKAFHAVLRDMLFDVCSEDVELLAERLEARVSNLVDFGASDTRNKVEAALRAHTQWVHKNVRRKVPSPAELIDRINKACNLFAPIVDVESKRAFFSDATWKAVAGVLMHVRKGCVSDVPGLSLYYRVGNKLYCTRGTSALEGFHYHLRRALHAHQVSPLLAHLTIAEFVRRWNMKMLHKKRGKSCSPH